MVNSRYAELYHLVIHQVNPGTTLEQILDYRRQRGTHFAASEVYRSVHFKQRQEVQEVADGRFMSISRAMMSDGGWLTTREDVTESARNMRGRLLT